MILRRKVVAPTREWEAGVEDSVPELNKAVEVSPPTVGAEEDVVDESRRTGRRLNLLTVSELLIADD